LLPTSMDGQKSKLSSHRASVNPEDPGCLASVNRGIREPPEARIDLPLFLSVAGVESGPRERGATAAAENPRDPGSVGLTIVDSMSDQAFGRRTLSDAPAARAWAEKAFRIEANTTQLG
jgi:hypothetical protein